MIYLKKIDLLKDKWDTNHNNERCDIRNSSVYFEFLKKKKKAKVIPYELRKKDKNQDIFVGQFFLQIKDFFFIRIYYIFCGPENYNLVSNYLKPELFYHIERKPIIYLRFKSLEPQNNHIIEKLTNNKWKYLFQPEINLILNLKKTLNSLKSNLTRNWRHNLKRSLKKNIEIKIMENNKNDQIEKLFQIYNEMKRIKAFRLPFSQNDFYLMNEVFKKNLITVCAYYNNEPVSFRSVLIYKNRALDFFSATNKIGRSIYASYKVFWKMLVICKKKKIYIYDLNCADKNNNPGVFNFKKGTGASIYKPIGIWENSNYEILINLIIIIRIIKNYYKKCLKLIINSRENL